MDVKQSIKTTLKGVAVVALASGVGLATSGCASMQGSCGKGSCGDSHQEDKSSCGKGSCS